MEETSKKVRHTAGPWIIENNRGDDGQCYWNEIQTKYGEVIAEVKGDDEGITNEQCDANTKLLVSAPQLLEALEELYSLTPDINYMTDTSTDFENALVQAIEKAKQAIKLAKGEIKTELI